MGHETPQVAQGARNEALSATGPVFAAAAVVCGLLGVAYHAAALWVVPESVYAAVGVISNWQSTLGVPLAALVIAVAAGKAAAPWRASGLLAGGAVVASGAAAAASAAAGRSTLGVWGVGLWVAACAAGVPARGVLIASRRLGTVACAAVCGAVLRVALVVGGARWGSAAAVLSAAVAEAVASCWLLWGCRRCGGRLSLSVGASLHAVSAQLGLWVAVSVAAQVAAVRFDPPVAAPLVAGVSLVSGLVALAAVRSQGAVPELLVGGAAARRCERTLVWSTLALSAATAAVAAVAWPALNAVFHDVFPGRWWVVAPVGAAAVWASASVPLTTLVSRRCGRAFRVWALVPLAAAAVWVLGPVAVWVGLAGAGAVVGGALWRASADAPAHLPG